MTPLGDTDPPGDRSPGVVWHHGSVGREERWAALGHAGATLWFTGLSGSGKSTVAAAVEETLVRLGRPAYRLDGDNLRHGLNADLGFSDEDRNENVRRVGEVAKLLADAGVVALVALVSPFRQAREAVRRSHAEAGLPFFEIFADTPLEVCRQRDPKGLYQRASSRQMSLMTGVDSPYEPPAAPELRLPLAELDVAEGARRVLALLG